MRGLINPHNNNLERKRVAWGDAAGQRLDAHNATRSTTEIQATYRKECGVRIFHFTENILYQFVQRCNLFQLTLETIPQHSLETRNVIYVLSTKYNKIRKSTSTH